MGAFDLNVLEKAELVRRATRQGGRSAAARRARVVVLLASGMTWDDVMHALDCSRGFVARWSQRFRSCRMSGLDARHRGRTTGALDRAAEARAVRAARARNDDGGWKWTSRSYAEHIGVSHMTVHRTWMRHGVSHAPGKPAR
ncbi:MAG TPA: helix-turn-helix domain-containing protein [Verrucomicrobiae bacterium]|nr:helix-turn-helix domain-containing protein [Verrucomicrobiae bacterium]